MTWPAFDPELAREDVIDIPVQVNGKMRGKVTTPVDASESDVVAAAKADENVSRHLDGRSVRKVIYVPNRMLNLIVG